MNWTISEVKQRGKETMKAGYWKCVLVALIMALVGGGVGGFSGNITGRYNAGSAQGAEILDNPGDILEMYAGDDYGRMQAMADELASSPNFGVIFGAVMGILFVVLVISVLISVFLLAPLTVGCSKFFKDAGEKREYNIGTVGFAFSSNYLNIVKIEFFVVLKVFLWSLLFVIPGIIKTYEYRMIPYILAENPGISSEEAFARTRQMMTGNKLRTFLLDLSFIGWIFLSALTLGILAIFYVNPYIYAVEAELYLTLKGEARNFGNNYDGGYGSYNSNPYGGNNQYGSSQYGNNQYDGTYNNTYGGYDSAGVPTGNQNAYQDADYRELNQGTTYDNGNTNSGSINAGNLYDGSASDTPAFGDKRNKPTNGSDNPFNVPY